MKCSAENSCTIVSFRVYRVLGLGFVPPLITPIMGNQMEKNMENEMESGMM